MKRLILLGNGFDLAHGLKTSYNDFMIWYLKQSFGQAWYSIYGYQDGLMEIKRTADYTNLWNIDAVYEYIDSHYQRGLDDLLYSRTPIFNVAFKSEFWKGLLLSCDEQHWVDIENEYYEKLKQCLNSGDKATELATVNYTLEQIIALLKRYLQTLKSVKTHNGYTQIVESPIYAKDVVAKHINGDEVPEDTLILNFNYTDTVEQYFSEIKQLLSGKPVHINYIHGHLQDDTNPLIFGFGDELDESYQKIELEKTKGFFTYIKSFWYFKTSNYHDLIRFIDSAEYQIFILGHSCGLSDRTMLNMIFEHENCKSIKIFYHQDSEGQDNYTALTEEISRHFKNKVAMRKKIVPFTRSTPMPQIS